MTEVAIIGAGPAGLTAAYLLTRRGVSVTVLEADPTYVGGLARTVEYKGFLFDIGGHRFFSKSQIVEDLWTELLGDDLVRRKRSSRIYYRGKFFAYPLKAGEALVKLGLIESAHCAASYVKARIAPHKDPQNFEDWVSNRFGKRLFNMFFKTYTEKVWGMSCREISADWAAQRIKQLSLSKALLHAVIPKWNRTEKPITTLIDSFRYPRKGPGMLWDAAAAKVRAGGGRVLMQHRVTALELDSSKGNWELICQTAAEQRRRFGAKHVISSAPIRDVFANLSPAPSPEANRAAGSLKYRDFLVVALILKDRGRFQDNWIYIHEPSVKVGRIQNFKSWSPEMSPDASLCCYGLEYFCFEGDGLWTSSDEALLELASSELVKLGLGEAEDILDGTVVRQKKAYPVYDDLYEKHVNIVRRELSERYPNLHLVGRNGMHKYNNQDHAMMTALLTVENILAKRPVYDVWRVNQDAQYIEEGKTGKEEPLVGLRMAPRRVAGS